VIRRVARAPSTAVLPAASALIFAPPPPVAGGVPGGIAALAAILRSELGHREDVAFGSPMRKEGGGVDVRRALGSLLLLRRALSGVRPHGSVLFFSSAGFSFWEKLAWAAVARIAGHRVSVVMVDGNFPRFFGALPGPLRSLARLLIRRMRLTIGAQSLRWETFYRDAFPGVRVARVAASVDRAFFDAERQPRRASRHFCLLYVGWIIEAKGVLDLLDAVAWLRDEGMGALNVRLVGPIFGDAARWTAEVERRALGDIVTLVGSVTDRVALVEEYGAADVFVFPSHYEGFPMAVVEAAAMGLPCIATDVGGIADILDAGRAGVIVPVRDPVTLAHAIAELLRDDARRDALAVALRAHAAANYTHARCAASYLSLLALE